MEDGLVFVWVEKECMVDVMTKFTEMGFCYVENVAWVKLDPEKENGILI